MTNAPVRHKVTNVLLRHKVTNVLVRHKMTYSDTSSGDKCSNDEHFRINFSIMGGVKLVFPLSKGMKFGQADTFTLSPNSPKMKPMKHSKTSIAKIIEGKKDEKGDHKDEKHPKKDTKKSKEKLNKEESSKLLLKDDSTKITTQQIERARRLSQLVEDINLQSVRGRRISKYKTLDQVVLAALGGGISTIDT
ncbi:hypothetical protein KUTeg_011834 [Tegillarca granosa]|uniref:Uncharacterized protein n=1 Tax=Tegillarca granosa TaxID=220873 RepID=A0ABQ9EXT5_TEGGR|nr:hypothetical protein KUTeg_011834 [Tegillarca granosa]